MRLTIHPKSSTILIALVAIHCAPTGPTPEGETSAAVGGGVVPGPPSIGIVTPSLGAELYETSPWYDPATETIRVRGGFSNVVPAQYNGQLRVIIDGTTLATITNGPGGTFNFSGRTPVADLDTVHRHTSAELVDLGSNTVLARKHITYFDFRSAANATANFDVGARVKGMGSQLTQTGLGNQGVDDDLTSLEVPVMALLPDPDLDTFNDELTANAQAVPNYVKENLEACIDLDDPDLNGSPVVDALRFSALAEALLVAEANYAIYQASQEVATGCAAFGPLAAAACQAGTLVWCVQDLPEIDDFELCIDRIEGEPTELTIESIDEIALAFTTTPPQSNGGRIKSHIRLENIEGRVDAHLGGLKVRWKDAACTGRPRATESPVQLLNDEEVAEWATCRDLEVNAAWADTESVNIPEEFVVQETSAGAETLSVRQVSDAYFGLLDVAFDPNHGTCALAFIAPEVEPMLGTFALPYRAAIDDTWNAGGARSDQAIALETVLDRYELGLLAFDDLSLSARLEPVRSDASDGLSVFWRTQVTALDVAVADRQRPGRLHLPEGDWLRWEDGLFEEINGVLVPFDLSYGVTTGYLNQILNLRGATDLLYFDFEPTRSYLSAAGFGSGAGTATVALNGTTLGRVHEVFEELDTTVVSIEVRPLLDPVIWMSPDPAVLEAYGAAISYETSQMEIIFRDETGKEWLAAHAMLLDESFTFRIDQDGGDHLLASYSDDFVFGVTIERSAFTTMTMDPHGVLEPADSEERDVEAALSTLFSAELTSRLLTLLSQVPAPQRWGGSVARGTAPHHVSRVNRWQADQYVTLFADIDDLATTP